MRYKLVIFDFDGTIADTSEGIIDAYEYSLNVLGMEIPSKEALKGFIGGNLLGIYENIFGLDAHKAREALQIYRERYSKVGIYKAHLYPGIIRLMDALQRNGVRMAVATLKAEKFARIMLEEMGISGYFDCVFGMDEDDTRDKMTLLKMCCEYCRCESSECILVGDSESDYKGAKNYNMDFLGVTYGFGFSKIEEKRFKCVNDVYEIVDELAEH